jgi:hypothetical protein
MDPTILSEKLSNSTLHPNLINWVSSFLSNRKQVVKTCSGLSQPTYSSIGSPQGCVISPILFTIYTDDLRSSRDNITLIKYADDTIVLEFLGKGQTSCLQQEFEEISTWCDNNSLILNPSKTRELVISNLRDNPDPSKLSVNGEEIGRVDEYKYLGTLITSKLSFDRDTENKIDKARKRLYLMNRLSHMQVSETMIKTVYTAFIESQLTYHLTLIYGHLSKENKKRLEHIRKIASKLSGIELRTVEDVYNESLKTRALKIIENETPPIEFERLPSGRYRSVKPRINLCSNSFRSKSISVLNEIFF